jgi:hypothetical protein
MLMLVVRFGTSLAIVLAALAATLSAQSKSSEAVVPYSLGSEWTYQSISRDAKGEVVERKVTTSKVVGLHLFDGDRWYCSNEDEFAVWSHISEQGEQGASVSLDEETQLLKKGSAYMFFKYPAKVGDQWDASDPDEADFKETMKLIDVALKVKVPAGEFDCYLYELQEDDKVLMKFYVAPGIGIVKMEAMPQDEDTGIETKELTKYKLVKE